MRRFVFKSSIDPPAILHEIDIRSRSVEEGSTSRDTHK
jgi:hypothetical protein